MIRIRKEGTDVHLFKDNREVPIYSIRKEELPLIIQKNDCKISLWINQLLSKTWIEENALYELAVLIQKEYPDNSIDWRNTFFPYEKGLYLKHVMTIKRMISENKTPSETFNDLFERVKVGTEEQNELVNSEISQIVDNKLIRYGLK